MEEEELSGAAQDAEDAARSIGHNSETESSGNATLPPADQVAQAANAAAASVATGASAQDKDAKASIDAASSRGNRTTNSTNTSQVAGIVPQGPKRVLVVCLQSAGCSLFMALLGQVDDTVSFIDLFVFTPVTAFPKPEDLEPQGAKFVFLKVTIQGDEVADPVGRLDDIKARFRPHHSILFLREPLENYEHLLKHINRDPMDFDRKCENAVRSDWGYAGRCGSIPGKLRAVEKLWRQKAKHFDAAVSYDDLVLDQQRWTNITSTMNSLGFPLTLEHFQMRSTLDDIAKYSRQRMGSAEFDWGTGDAADGPIQLHDVSVDQPPNSRSRAVVNLSCPTLAAEFPKFRSYRIQGESGSK